jgi:argininosuccinate lyase
MELVRAKTGRLVGNLVTLLVVTKGIPSTYDRDLQEDKEPLFDTLDTLAMLLPIVAGVIETLQVNAEAMREVLSDAMLATDLADYLVKRGVPFRQAHGLVGQVVLLSEKRARQLGELDLADYERVSPLFGPDLYAVLDFEASVEAHDVAGGTALGAVREQIERARGVLSG